VKTILRRICATLFSGKSVPWTNKNAAYSKYTIGDWTYGAPIVKDLGQNTSLTIGRYCSIAYDVTIMLGGEHRSDWVTTYPFAELMTAPEGAPKIGLSKGDVHIGSDVWIGLEAMILSGVTIGHGAIIGARAVVSKDVEPYSIVAGNPARHLRFRASAKTINQLLKIEWWNWNHEKVLLSSPLLLSDRLEEFLQAHGVESYITE
jgi:acetyltransferase-like isoleucine patch superfamily enzyme